MILARESVFRSGYFPGFSIFIIIITLTIILYCTFRRISLLSFYIFSMPPAGFEPTFPASEHQQTDALDCAVTGIELV